MAIKFKKIKSNNSCIFYRTLKNIGFRIKTSTILIHVNKCFSKPYFLNWASNILRGHNFYFGLFLDDYWLIKSDILNCFAQVGQPYCNYFLNNGFVKKHIQTDRLRMKRYRIIQTVLTLTLNLQFFCLGNQYSKVSSEFIDTLYKMSKKIVSRLYNVFGCDKRKTNSYMNVYSDNRHFEFYERNSLRPNFANRFF